MDCLSGGARDISDWIKAEGSSRWREGTRAVVGNLLLLSGDDHRSWLECGILIESASDCLRLSGCVSVAPLVCACEASDDIHTHTPRRERRFPVSSSLSPDALALAGVTARDPVASKGSHSLALSQSISEGAGDWRERSRHRVTRRREREREKEGERLSV